VPRDPYLENAIMNVLWASGSWMTPGEVRDALPEDRMVGYTTVMTVLSRLWKKGRLDRHRQGRAFAYLPVRSRSEYAALRMEEILDAAGDRSVTLTRFVESLSASERRRLQQSLEEGS
jgi:predicted transcriptional regulator